MCCTLLVNFFFVHFGVDNQLISILFSYTFRTRVQCFLNLDSLD